MVLGCLCVDFWLWSFASERELDMKQIFRVIVCVALFAGLPAFADLDKGWDAYEKGDYATALREWRPLAEQGDVIAQYYLGWLYDNGEGVELDYSQALRWYRLAAEQGDADAQHSIGILYHNGQGVSQDYEEAIKWFVLAAEQDYLRAQNALGSIYEEGRGGGDLPRMRKAGIFRPIIRWFYDYFWGIPADYDEANKWYSLAAEQGDVDAQLALGRINEDGLGGLPNYANAYMWYSISASNGNTDGKNARDNLAENLTPEQIEGAQKRTNECVAKDYKGC